MIEATEALRSYRRDMPKPLMDALAGFQSMTSKDQKELLFFMMMHVNSNMARIMDRVGVEYEVNPPAPKDN